MYVELFQGDCLELLKEMPDACVDAVVTDPYAEHRGRRMVDKSRIDGKPPSLGRNIHPTVKPIALMQWLVRLVTPPDGLVLDPFMGSGTTGIAAAREGFDFVGLELDPDYLAIAQARIDHSRGIKDEDRGAETCEVL